MSEQQPKIVGNIPKLAPKNIAWVLPLFLSCFMSAVISLVNLFLNIFYSIKMDSPKDVEICYI